MTPQYIFDISVYRLPEDAYSSEWADYFAKNTHSNSLLPSMVRNAGGSNGECNLHSHLETECGGCWSLNEIIGYIRLYFLVSQVRGEYYEVNKKRVYRTGRKTLKYKFYKIASESTFLHPVTMRECLP